MRIDFVTDTFPPDVNGVAMTLGRLTQCLKERGHYVHVLHTGNANVQGQTSHSSFTLPGYKEVRVGLPCPLKLRKRWKRKRPDAIYVATESPLGASAINAAREMGIPVAAGFHTNFQQYMKKYKLGSIEKPAMAYLRKVHAKADCTVAPSADVVKMLESAGFDNVRLMGRGVDAELFHPSKSCAMLRSEWGARTCTPVVLIAGRVAAEKNLELAMRSVEQMRARMPDLKVVVVGDGPLLEKLRSDYSEVIFTGMLQGENLAKAYASADILLFPSETETFGNVLLEGMSSGLVTVSYRYAASALFVRDGENGLHAEHGDADDFLDKCMLALQLYTKEEVRANARSTVEAQGWSLVAETFECHMQEIIARKPAIKRRFKERKLLHLRSLFLSDIHLGTPGSKAREVVDLLKCVRCERIYLNGDIIDGWALKRGAKWQKAHTKVIRVLLKKMEKEKCELIYLRGNHDDFLERILPMEIGGVKVVKEWVHEAVDGKKYLVIHGDGFDSVSTNHKWLAGIGAVGYDFLLGVNRFYNNYRAWRGKEYYSLSQAVKAKVKSAVSFVDNYEEKLQGLAKVKGCDGIICGHIHTPSDKQVGEVHYLNSGDWVETMSCVLEHFDGSFEVAYYEELLERLERKPEEMDVANTEDDDAADGGGLNALRGEAVLQMALGREGMAQLLKANP